MWFTCWSRQKTKKLILLEIFSYVWESRRKAGGARCAHGWHILSSAKGLSCVGGGACFCAAPDSFFLLVWGVNPFIGLGSHSPSLLHHTPSKPWNKYFKWLFRQHGYGLAVGHVATERKRPNTVFTSNGGCYPKNEEHSPLMGVSKSSMLAANLCDPSWQLYD